MIAANTPPVMLEEIGLKYFTTCTKVAPCYSLGTIITLETKKKKWQLYPDKTEQNGS